MKARDQSFRLRFNPPARAGGRDTGTNVGAAIEHNASDIHLKVGAPPTFRVHGALRPTDGPKLTEEQIRAEAEMEIRSLIDTFIDAVKEHVADEETRDRIRRTLLTAIPEEDEAA